VHFIRNVTRIEWACDITKRGNRHIRALGTQAENMNRISCEEVETRELIHGSYMEEEKWSENEKKKGAER